MPSLSLNLLLFIGHNGPPREKKFARFGTQKFHQFVASICFLQESINFFASRRPLGGEGVPNFSVNKNLLRIGPKTLCGRYFSPKMGKFFETAILTLGMVILKITVVKHDS